MMKCDKKLTRNLIAGTGLEIMAIVAHEWTKENLDEIKSNIITGMFALTGLHFIGSGINKRRKCPSYRGKHVYSFL